MRVHNRLSGAEFLPLLSSRRPILLNSQINAYFNATTSTKHKTVKRGWFLCFAFEIIAAQDRARFYALKQSEGTNDSNRQIKEARHRDHSQSSYAASHIFTLSGLRCSFFRLRISRVERWGIKNNNK